MLGVFRMNGHFYLLLQQLTGHGVLCARSGDHCTFHRDDSVASYRYHGDVITMKFIHVEVECSSSPIFTSRDIWPIGQMVYLLNPMSDVVDGIIWLLISGRSLTKQCSYRTSEDAPPSTYVRCTNCPPISASMIIGPSVSSSSPKDGKEIIISEEKLWVTLCLATLSHG
ncbi:hypothetical protein Tco_1090876 [Tanacetum coccineum]|uniref:Uncharacterized protein n=1 Tax=Tanacetum coccineum TaxID=301880 RepID=A0ABQ5I5G6_9ASTR